jgi:probable rRNA maturation factor
MLTSGTEKADRAKTPRLALTVQYATAATALPSRARLRIWAHAALRRDAVITLRFVGGREGRALNRRYRRRDYATNVLTFVYAERPALAGDIALCPPVATREARERGVPIRDHYAHLVVHGVLHLQGHDHQRPAEAARMERLESRILARLGCGDPYSEEKRAEREKRRNGRNTRRSSRRHSAVKSPRGGTRSPA